ncbi:aminotransferase [Synechococcus moorigangaii CMS01]|nr:aminotransferase [Synechococcus moorigangaii CMS01]
MTMGYWYAGAWYDGDDLSLQVNDPSFLFGATLFTTMRVHNGRLDDPRTLWSRHGDRLRHSLEALQWASPDWDRIEQGAAKLASLAPVVRVTILSDGRELILGRPLPAQLAQHQQQGVIGWFAQNPQYQRPQADFKTGNYLSAWQARQRAIALGAEEAILCDVTGRWLETATGNLWGWKQGSWYTPPLGGILPGVMRSHLIQQLNQAQIPVRESPWTADLVEDFEAIAYSNSVVGVIPFRGILGVKNVPWLFPVGHAALGQLQHWSGQLLP